MFAPLAQSSVAAIPGLLWVLLAVDLALILLHAALGLAEDRGLIAQHPPLFDLNRDFAVPESWGYLKWLVGAGICLAAAGGRRLAALWPPAVIFLILLS
ncbi:MAG: hypothetical protein IT514_16575 [Burkholderiales bacterium]|nr:hypothetical protein [Burkholderiales bacterium]